MMSKSIQELDYIDGRQAIHSLKNWKIGHFQPVGN